MNKLLDRLLLAVIRRRLRSRPGFFSEVTETALDYWRAKKAAEAAERVSLADEAITKLSKRLECQRMVSDTIGTTNSLPIQ
jgi:hypothetical protein